MNDEAKGVLNREPPRVHGPRRRLLQRLDVRPAFQVRVRSCRAVVPANRSEVFPRTVDNRAKHHAHSRRQRGRTYGGLALLVPKSCDTRV